MKKSYSYDPGTGLSASSKQQRIMNKDGSFNITHINRDFEFRDIYGYLINASWRKFILLISLGYLFINFLFGLVYYLIGIDDIGIVKTHFLTEFLHCFYFSTQTFTTIGYGFLAPKTIASSSVAAIEGFIGLLFFAFASGLFYGRFSKPTADFVFTKNCIIKEHNNGRALMFKIAHKHTHVAMNVHVESVMASKKDENQKTLYSYFPIKMERERIAMMPYTWTIVHQIDENSPLFDYTNEQIKNLDAELLILSRYFDDTFSQEIYQRHSYLFEEIELEKIFAPNFYYNNEGQGVLDHGLMHKTISPNEDI